MPGRIRTLKPELREWEPFAGLTDAAARLFVMIPTMADDAGRCPASPSFIAGQVFYVRQRSANVIGQLLAELEEANLIRRYTAKGGSFLEVVGWSDKDAPTYQYIKRPHPQRYPAPPWDQTSTATTAETTAEPPPDLDQEQDQRSGPGTGPRSLIAELEAMLSSLPPGPGGLKPPAGGAAVAAMRVAVEAGELTVAGCRKVAEDLIAKVARGDLALTGERHLDNTLASWVRAAADRAAGRTPRPKKKRNGTKAPEPKPKPKPKLGRKGPQAAQPQAAQAHAQAATKLLPKPPTLPDNWQAPEGTWCVGDVRGGVWHQFDGRKYVKAISTHEMGHPLALGMTVYGPQPTQEFGTAVFVWPDKARAKGAA